MMAVDKIELQLMQFQFFTHGADGTRKAGSGAAN